MIIKGISGQSFKGLLQYQLEDLKGTKVIGSNNLYIEDDNKLDTLNLTKQFLSVSNQSKTEKPVYHFVLSFSHDDIPKLDFTNTNIIAVDFLKQMGMDEHQFLVVSHDDKKHYHLHLTVNRVHEGLCKEKSNEKKKMYEAARYIETEYNLSQPLFQQIQSLKKEETPGHLKFDIVPNQTHISNAITREIKNAFSSGVYTREKFSKYLRNKGISQLIREINKGDKVLSVPQFDVEIKFTDRKNDTLAEQTYTINQSILRSFDPEIKQFIKLDNYNIDNELETNRLKHIRDLNNIKILVKTRPIDLINNHQEGGGNQLAYFLALNNIFVNSIAFHEYMSSKDIPKPILGIFKEALETKSIISELDIKQKLYTGKDCKHEIESLNQIPISRYDKKFLSSRAIKDTYSVWLKAHYPNLVSFSDKLADSFTNSDTIAFLNSLIDSSNKQLYNPYNVQTYDDTIQTIILGLRLKERLDARSQVILKKQINLEQLLTTIRSFNKNHSLSDDLKQNIHSLRIYLKARGYDIKQQGASVFVADSKGKKITHIGKLNVSFLNDNVALNILSDKVNSKPLETNDDKVAQALYQAVDRYDLKSLKRISSKFEAHTQFELNPNLVLNMDKEQIGKLNKQIKLNIRRTHI